MGVTPAATDPACSVWVMKGKGKVGTPQMQRRYSCVGILTSPSLLREPEKQSTELPKFQNLRDLPACESTLPRRGPQSPQKHTFAIQGHSRLCPCPELGHTHFTSATSSTSLFPRGKGFRSGSGEHHTHHSLGTGRLGAISIQYLLSKGPSSCRFDFIIMPTHLLNSPLSFFCTVDLHC